MSPYQKAGKSAQSVTGSATVAFCVASLTVGLLVGWHAGPVRTVTEHETVVRLVAMPDMAGERPTPFADSLVDWEHVETETDCLWEYLQAHFGWDITLDRVFAAGYWTDELGGACAVIGRDDE